MTDEIFRQVPSREIPDMARLDGGMEGWTEERDGQRWERDETGMAHDTRPSLAPRVVLARMPVIINNPSSLSYHCYTLLIAVIDQVSCLS